MPFSEGKNLLQKIVIKLGDTIGVVHKCLGDDIGVDPANSIDAEGVSAQ